MKKYVFVSKHRSIPLGVDIHRHLTYIVHLSRLVGRLARRRSSPHDNCTRRLLQDNEVVRHYRACPSVRSRDSILLVHDNSVHGIGITGFIYAFQQLFFIPHVISVGVILTGPFHYGPLNCKAYIGIQSQSFPRQHRMLISSRVRAWIYVQKSGDNT